MNPRTEHLLSSNVESKTSCELAIAANQFARSLEDKVFIGKRSP
jgi:hypothetical protein